MRVAARPDRFLIEVTELVCAANQSWSIALWLALGYGLGMSTDDSCETRLLLSDEVLRAVLVDASVRRFQQTVPTNKNADPHIFVRSLAEHERGADPSDILGRALRDGSVDEAIVAQNVALGWMAYAPDLLERDRSQGVRPTFMRSGHRLTMTQVPFAALRSFLKWCLAGPKPYGGEVSTSAEEAQAMIGGTIAALCGSDERTAVADWQFWRVIPDFLHSSEDLQTESGEPVFFDSLASNYAWMGLGPERFFLVLVSVYPCLTPFDAES